MSTRQKYDYVRETYVDPMPGRDGAEVLGELSCGRCGGRGYMDEYAPIDDGRCFECHGSGGKRPLTVDHLRDEARREVARVNRYRLKDAKAAIVRTANLAAAVAVRPEWARADAVEDDFVRSLRGKLDRYELTERQVEAGADAIIRWESRAELKAEEEAAKAAMSPLEAGRGALVGTILAVKSEEGAFGYHATTIWKMMLELESGHRVWGTAPAGLWDQLNAEREDGAPCLPMGALKGRRASLTATVEPSASDNSFGYYSRPTKPSLI